MIDIKTYLRCEDGSFIQVADCKSLPTDPDYIEGAIELSVDGTLVIGKSEWDYVDQLWFYISEMVRVMLEEGSSSTYFPDQPIELSFQQEGGKIFISCEIEGKLKKFDVPEMDFLNALKNEGRIFFEKMSEILPENSESYKSALRDLLS
ncbi:hypothetical protein [Streptosporangium roseum]|uniref:hypothetical protein n=1 Tax=Streptosporangium roseum TaxID=2001 RepID=UPI0033312D74